MGSVARLPQQRVWEIGFWITLSAARAVFLHELSVLLPWVRRGHRCKALHCVLEANSQAQRNHPHMPLGQWNVRWTWALGLPNYNGWWGWVGLQSLPLLTMKLWQTGFQETSTAIAVFHHAPYIPLQEARRCLTTSKVFILQSVQRVPRVSCPAVLS